MTDPLTDVFMWELSREYARIADLRYQSQMLYEWYMAGEIESDDAIRLDARINHELEKIATQRLTIPF